MALKNKKIDGEYDRKVNKPKKHDAGCLRNIIIQKHSITSSKKKLEEGYIELPLSKAYKKTMKDESFRPRIKILEENHGIKSLSKYEYYSNMIMEKCLGANFTYGTGNRSMEFR